MSGHSKWANIQHRKGRQDAKRSNLWTKLVREIIVAARMGGGDPDTNSRLRLALIKARGGKVRPSHTITVNGIEKATDEYKMPAEYSSFVRNWFVAADGEGDPNKLSVEDSMGEVLSNGEVNKIIKNAAGDFAAKAVSSPLLKPIYPVKVKTMIKLAGKLGVDEKMLSLAGGFLQTIDKN